jgi:hypothetical protein
MHFRFEEASVARSTYFDALGSKRRGKLVQDVATQLARKLEGSWPDRLAYLKPWLNQFHVYAADGHWHSNATHDEADVQGRKRPVGHIFGMNLSSGLMYHVTQMDQVKRDKEHDMRALKRCQTDQLRFGHGKKQKVILVYDRASIDFTVVQLETLGSPLCD